MSHCECGHPKKEHDKINGCMNRAKPGEDMEYRDGRGYCVCVEWFQV